MNPYEPPKTEPPHSDEPSLKYHHPVWTRVPALGVLFTLGGLTLIGLKQITDDRPLMAATYFALA